MASSNNYFTPHEIDRVHVIIFDRWMGWTTRSMMFAARGLGYIEIVDWNVCMCFFLNGDS
jgi:hypothetical protein